MVVDCHVNIWNEEHLTALYAQQIGRARPGGAPGLKADADNAVVEGTRLPRVSQEVIEGIIQSDLFAHWWHDYRS
jgi:hypothetical protein